MKKILTLAATMAVGLLSVPAVATVLVVADFEGGINTDAVIGNWGWRTDVTNDTDVPDGGGTGSMKGVATDTGGMGLRFNSDPTFAGAADFSGYSYINFYMKVDETGNDFSFSLRCCQEDNDPRRSNAALASLFEPPAAGTWGYISIALADIDLGPAGGATEALQWTNVESAWLQLSGGVGATVWVDHITLTDTSAEGMLGDPPPAPTLLVVADFEGGINTDAVIGNWGWRTDVTNDTDVPDGGGTGSMKGVATDTGGMGLRFNSDPTFAGAADFSGYSYINFYMKVDETGNDFSFSLRCCQEDNDPRRSNAALASLFEPPAAGTWGYISIALADIDLGPAGGATEALQWTNVESAWLQLSGGVGATVWVDHITLTDTSARGMLAAPPEPPAEGMPVSTNWALIFTVAAVMFSAVLFFGRKSLRS